ncbi:MAG: dienelactone hydrolase family protein [Gammaproteobacteria bacterium]|nr:dienelactone hydrolase family protein [Gammaproteobacteria bacterium]
MVEQVAYHNGDKEIPAYLFRPDGGDRHPGVIFVHGRRGLDDLTLRHPRRLAARGFLVLVPDLWFANFIDKFPIEHDPVVEADVAIGIDFLLTLPALRGDRICVVSHTRGGYISLKALVTHARQEKAAACWVSYYPHLQDPNLPEPMQIYRYAPEVDALTVPALIFFGGHEQYQRHRPITFAYESLKEMGRDVRLIVYPGVGRGFDFRPPHVRTFADDLAAKDAMQRSLYPATSASPLAAPCQAAVSDTKSGARGDRVTSTYTLARRV